MSYPQIVVAPSAAKRIVHFDCWVFRDELQRLGAELRDGGVVELTDRAGTFLAYAFYSTRSHIAARVVSTDRAVPVDRALLAQRLADAIRRRTELTGVTAKRLVFSEADGLPGLIVDQYAEWLVLQSRTAGLEIWKPTVVELLREQLHPAGILERSDKEFRDAEGLPPVTGVLDGTVPERIPIHEDDLTFLVDPHRGHKTGFYLDQRDTRRALRHSLAPGARVLDAFAYTGAFGIAAASQGALVTYLEQEEALLPLAKEQAALNRVADRMSFIAGDAFYWLEAKAGGRERFDWVLLDPPALAKSKTDVPKARRALHHLVVNGLKLLAPRGTLVLSVCTYHLLELAEEILRIAASDAGCRLTIRAITHQAADHPWILQMPMTHYLTSWMAQREE